MIRFGPFKRKERPGVPTDHFVPFRDANRFARFDHHGRVTTLIAEGEPTATVVDEFEWTDDLTGTFASAGMDPADDGYQAAIERDAQILNGGTGVEVATAPWAARREQIFATLIWALGALGVTKADDLPILADMDDVANADYSYAQAADDHFGSLHQGKAVTHTHLHSTYGAQGGDKTHSHQHSHNGDANHNHHAAASKASTTETVTRVTGPEHLAAKVAELRIRQAVTSETERTAVKVLTAAGAPAFEVDLPVRWDDDAFDPYWPNEDGTLGRKGAFVSTLTAAGADMPELVDNPGGAWDSYLCIEGVRTDEGYFSRELMPDAIQFPDLPVSMRLQIEDEGGHYGAVTCGRIDTMERVPYPDGDGLNAIAASGAFGTDENGQVAQLLVEEQTQRFVSVDLRDMESEIVEVAISINVSSGPYMDDCDDDSDGVFDWWLRVTSAVIGGATIVAMPALQQAVIVMTGVDLPTAPLALDRAPATAVTVTASGNPALLAAPPASWFEDPQFHVGDPRLVRQPDGHRACPLTITDDGQVYGHAAYWGAEHTGVRGRNGKGVSPPRSPSYGYFMTGSVTTAEGDEIAVGPLTMGCGHAALSLPYKPALAHYDGGYGAVQVANVRMGEDDFGIWFAGALTEPKSDANPKGPTDEEVRLFKTMGISGDWRQIAGKTHLVAALAVPVPGFPITRESLVASAVVTEAIEQAQLTSYRNDQHGDLVSLVAAGRVRHMSGDERMDQMQAALEILLDDRRRARQAAVLDRLGKL